MHQSIYKIDAAPRSERGWQSIAIAIAIAIALVAAAVAAAATPMAPVDAPADPGDNLLRILDETNCTADTAASTTVPGWTATAGSPSLLCPPLAGARPAVAIGPALISSGPYESSALERNIAVGAAAEVIDRRAMTFQLSGWLGSAGARAVLTLTFRDAAGQPLHGLIRRESPAAAPGSAWHCSRHCHRRRRWWCQRRFRASITSS